MNLNVQNEGRFQSFLERLVIYLALVFGFVLFNGSDSRASLIDSKFRMGRSFSPARIVDSVNDVGFLYKKFLAKSMYSHCRWFPSDSQYMLIKSQECGSFRGTLLAFSRFMMEYDADKISKNIVNDHGYIRFLNFGSNNCEIF